MRKKLLLFLLVLAVINICFASYFSVFVDENGEFKLRLDALFTYLAVFCLLGLFSSVVNYIQLHTLPIHQAKGLSILCLLHLLFCTLLFV